MSVINRFLNECKQANCPPDHCQCPHTCPASLSHSSLPFLTSLCSSLSYAFSIITKDRVQVFLAFSILLHQHSKSKHCICCALPWHEAILSFIQMPWFFIFSNFLSADIVFLKSKRKNKFQIIMQVWSNVTGTTLNEHSALHNLKVLNKSQTAQSAYPLSWAASTWLEIQIGIMWD